MNLSESRYASLKEVAAVLGKQVSYLRNIARAQELEAQGKVTRLSHLLDDYPEFKKVGSEWAIWLPKLHEWIKQQERKTA